MAIFSDRDLSFSEVCEDLSWVRARSPHNEMMRTQLYARLLPCSVRGRAPRRARGVWLFVEARMQLVLSTSTIPSHAVRPGNWHQLLHNSAN